MKTAEEIAAYHQAGHVVAAYLRLDGEQRPLFEKVSIERDERGELPLEFRLDDGDFLVDAVAGGTHRPYSFKRVTRDDVGVVAVAGLVGEELALGGPSEKLRDRLRRELELHDIPRYCLVPDKVALDGSVAKWSKDARKIIIHENKEAVEKLVQRLKGGEAIHQFEVGLAIQGQEGEAST